MARPTLWGETKPPRRKRNTRNCQILTSEIPYSITGNDCELLGHTLNHWSLAGTTTCMDCGATIFCPGCTPAHLPDPKAIPMLCERHQESQVNHAV